MRRAFYAICLSLSVTLGATTLYGQGNVKRGPDPSAMRDPELERDSMHNLEVARQYFRMKKAYRAALARCEEIIASNPNFARLDEALYLAGSSSWRLADNQGRQAPAQSANKLREDARDYLSRVVNEFPQSSFRERAERELRPLGGVKPKPKGK